MNGQTYDGPQMVFDKVGVYAVTLNARDDPHPDHRYPDNAFDSYRKWSNSFTQNVVVHRRPVAQFTLSANGDGTIAWNDTSWDPDRFDPNTGAASAPDVTGYNYAANRGILERKYSYTSPSGTFVNGKLTRPSEAGTYTAYLQVKDEYGAWSTPASFDIYSAGGLLPHNKPAATLTYPNGSQASPTLVYTTRPNLTWAQSDPDGDILKSYDIQVLDESGAYIVGSGETAQWSNVTNWTVPLDLQTGKKYQVRVRVADDYDWSNWSNTGWMIINSPPKVSITDPNGRDKDTSMLIVDNRRPQITWRQSDKENNFFKKLYIQVLDQYGNLQYETGWDTWQNTGSNTNSFTIPQDLPTNVPLQVKMKVTDDDPNIWSDWSNTAWLLIDMTPSADVTNPSGSQTAPAPMSPTPMISFNEWDPDPLNAFAKYQVQFINEANTAVLHDSGEMSQNLAGQWRVVNYKVPDYAALPAGVKVQVTARVYDGYVWSPWSPRKWLLTNRPPVPDFDWTPKPVWEGDPVNVINRSSDPDGNSLSYEWTVRSRMAQYIQVQL